MTDTNNQLANTGRPALDSAPSNVSKPSRGSESYLEHGLIPDTLAASLPTALGLGSSYLDSVKTKISEIAASVFSNWGFGEQATIQSGMRDFLVEVDRTQLEAFLESAVRPVEGWGYRDRDEVARGLCRIAIPMLFTPDSTVTGLENLEQVRDRSVFLGNHLAAVDVHGLDTALVQNGFNDIADRLTAVVGHKTFQYPVLRQASLAFGTLQVPQCMSVSTRSQELGVREMARGARLVIDAAKERINSGDALVVFPEGTRSRSGEMLSTMPAVARYVRGANAVVVPFAHYGTEGVLPPDTFQFKQGSIHFRFGKPVESDALNRLSKGEDRQKVMMDTIGYMISNLLPEGYQGHYQNKDVPAELKRAFSIAEQLI